VLREKRQHIDLKSDPNNQQLRALLNDITPRLMVDVSSDSP
jgi:hypothetical protein